MKNLELMNCMAWHLNYEARAHIEFSGEGSFMVNLKLF